MRIFAITVVVYQHTKHFYLDELYKEGEYRWDEPDHEEKPSDTTPIYFIKLRHSKIGDDCSFKFEEKHFRFLTTIKRIRKKYGEKDTAQIHF